MDPLEFTPWHRNDARGIAEVKETFSDWDTCMTEAYCKWPAIIGIALAGLALIGIVWCIVGCLCCGYTCCKGCCSCCSCCCPSSSHRDKDRSKFSDNPMPYQNPNQSPMPYQNQNPNIGYRPAPPPPVYEAQKFATFDTSNNNARSTPVNEDALPSMPTWGTATTRRVEDTSQDMEMNHLDPSTGQNTGGVVPVGRAGRGGYHEMPEASSSPVYAHDGYRGTQPTATPYHSNSAGAGIARSPSPYLPNTSPYMANAPVNNYQNHNNVAMYNDAPPRSYTRSPASPTFSPYPPSQPQQQQQPQSYSYAPYEPTPSSPPPPFPSTNGDSNTVARAPSLLQAGRKPVQNSWRDV